MDARHYLTCLWPGMAELWWRGRLAALPTAITFAVAVNLVLITRFLYPEWLSGLLVRLAFWVGVVAWLVWVIRSIRELPELIAPRLVSDQPDRWPEARSAYLAGSWSEAEGLLSDVLAVEPRDPPALLLLAGVYRHTARLNAAEELLEQISRLEAADPWWLEREAECRRLERDRGDSKGVTAGDVEGRGDEEESRERSAEPAGASADRSSAADLTEATAGSP